MPVEFLTEAQAAAYAAFGGAPSAGGFDVRDEDVARLSPFVRQHVNMLGRYSFQLPELPGGMRPLRDPDAAEEV